MARWRLTEAHYIYGKYPHSEDTEWEYKEVDRLSGREVRKRYKVPAYFEKDTIVCWEGKGDKTDCIFEGNPTGAMEPIDDEAQEITERLRSGFGEHPIDSLRTQGWTDDYSDSLTRHFEKKLNEIAAKTPIPQAQTGVSKEEFDALRAQLAQLMAEKAEPPEPPKRRV